MCSCSSPVRMGTSSPCRPGACVGVTSLPSPADSQGNRAPRRPRRAAAARAAGRRRSRYSSMALAAGGRRAARAGSTKTSPSQNTWPPYAQPVRPRAPTAASPASGAASSRWNTAKRAASWSPGAPSMRTSASAHRAAHAARCSARRRSNPTPSSSSTASSAPAQAGARERAAVHAASRSTTRRASTTRSRSRAAMVIPPSPGVWTLARSAPCRRRCSKAGAAVASPGGARPGPGSSRAAGASARSASASGRTADRKRKVRRPVASRRTSTPVRRSIIRSVPATSAGFGGSSSVAVIASWSHRGPANSPGASPPVYMPLTASRGRARRPRSSSAARVPAHPLDSVPSASATRWACGSPGSRTSHAGSASMDGTR
jgi:hypothetical protein